MEIKWPAHCKKCQFHDKVSGTEYCTYCYETGKSRIVEYLGKDYKIPATEEELIKQTNMLNRVCTHYKDERIKKEEKKKSIVITTRKALNIRKSFAEEQKKSAERMELYNQGLTDKQIADKLLLDKSTIRYWRKKNGLPTNAK